MTPYLVVSLVAAVTSFLCTPLVRAVVVRLGGYDIPNDRKLHREVRLNAGDAIVLIHGIHAIKVIEDMQALSVKQGPFLGDAEDKVVIEGK